MKGSGKQSTLVKGFLFFFFPLLTSFLRLKLGCNSLIKEQLY